MNKWVETETNFYSVSTYRKLALNAYASLNSGDAVVVSGRLHIRPWQTADKAGTNVDIDVDWMGHDLTLGTARWTRLSAAAANDVDQTQFGATGQVQTDFDETEPEQGVTVDDGASVPF
ncbi:hypothetical protein GCM10027057_22780 [Marisediminicola antarctica]